MVRAFARSWKVIAFRGQEHCGPTVRDTLFMRTLGLKFIFEPQKAAKKRLGAPFTLPNIRRSLR